MKVLFSHDHRFVRDNGLFYSRGGLPEVVLARYSEFFGSVDVACRAEDGPSTGLAPINRPDIRFHPQQNLRHPLGLKHYIRVKKHLSELVAKVDTAVARLPSLLGLLVAGEARRQRVPCLVEVVGDALGASMLHGSWLGRVTGHMEHWLTKREVRQAKIVVYITERYLQSIYPTRGVQFVCPNVSLQLLSEDGLLLRQAHRPRGDRPKIGLVGSLDVNYKGHRVAIDVLNVLEARHNMRDVSLEFVGGGDAQRWREYAFRHGTGDRVQFHGAKPAGEAMMAWIDDMDILLQPSLTEAQGRAIIEAMSRGRPVVASNVGGIRELLDPEWLAEPLDAAALATKCSRLLREPLTYKSVSTSNWATASLFDSTRIETVRTRAFSILREEAHRRRPKMPGQE